MKASTTFISLSEVEELHERLINSFGGSPGIADAKLLETMVFLPHSGYEDKIIRHLNYENIFEQAAALLQGFCINNCFKNSNRSSGVFVALTFLKMNGYTLKVSNEELVTFIQEQVVTKKIEIKAIAKWLEQNLF